MKVTIKSNKFKHDEPRIIENVMSLEVKKVKSYKVLKVVKENKHGERHFVCKDEYIRIEDN